MRLIGDRVQTLLEERAGSRLWDFERSIAHGSNKRGVAAAAKSLEYWNDMRKRVDRKSKAGFDTSFTDYWGLGLSQQLINAPDGGPGMCTRSCGRG
jgi:lysophospholipase